MPFGNNQSDSVEPTAKSAATSHCSKCGGTIKPGSLTAWIFSGDEALCLCHQDDVLKSASETQPSKDPFVLGNTIAERYVLQDVLGRGAFGTVYKAFDTKFDGRVALKSLNRNHINDPQVLERFIREADLARSFGHPNLMIVHDYGFVEQTPFIVMEFVDGENLADELSKSGPLTPEKFISIFAQCCSGLACAHSRGVIHRDLKPSNIVLQNQPDGSLLAKIVDFGIAHISEEQDATSSKNALTQHGEIFGSPSYMSPEQCRGEKLDQRSDLYSLGCVMYEALTGQPPFQGTTPLQVILKQINDSPPRFISNSLRTTSSGMQDRLQSLQNITFRCLSKDLTNRYQQAEQIERDLKVVNLGQVIPAQSSGQNNTRTESTRFPDRLKQALGAAICIIVGFCLALAIAVKHQEASEVDQKSNEKERWIVLDSEGQAALNSGLYSKAVEKFNAALVEADELKTQPTYSLRAAVDLLDAATLAKDDASIRIASARLAALKAQIRPPVFYAEDIQKILIEKKHPLLPEDTNAPELAEALILRASQMSEIGANFDAQVLLNECLTYFSQRRAVKDSTADSLQLIQQKLKVAQLLETLDEYSAAAPLMKSLLAQWPPSISTSSPLHLKALLHAGKIQCDSGKFGSDEAKICVEKARELADSILGESSEESAESDLLSAKLSLLIAEAGNRNFGDTALVEQALQKFRALPEPKQAEEAQCLVIEGRIKKDPALVEQGLKILERTTNWSVPFMRFALEQRSELEHDPIKLKSWQNRADQLKRRLK